MNSINCGRLMFGTDLPVWQAHDDCGLTKRCREYARAFRATGHEAAANAALHGGFVTKVTRRCYEDRKRPRRSFYQRLAARSVPVGVGCGYEHSRVADGEDVNLLFGDFVHDAVGLDDELAEPVGIGRKCVETFGWDSCADVVEVGELACGFVEFTCPAHGIVKGKFAGNDAKNVVALVLRVIRPCHCHFVSPRRFIPSSISSDPVHVLFRFEFALRELAAGDFDVAGKLHLVEDAVQLLGIDEVRGGASVLRDEDGAVRFPHAVDVQGEIVAALRERHDILGRTATAKRHFTDGGHGYFSFDV